MTTQQLLEPARFTAPGGRPQPIAFANGRLWIGAWDTQKLYAVEPASWTVSNEFELPGKPYGIAAFGAGLRLVISEGEDDDRYFYDAAFSSGVIAGSRMPCPDMTGSHLASDGETLYLTQMTNRRILAFDAAGSIVRTIPLPTRTAGIAFGPAGFTMISADADFDNLAFATLDVHRDAPEATVIAPMPEESRGLAYDGTRWWTNLREIGETLSFRVSIDQT